MRSSRQTIPGAREASGKSEGNDVSGNPKYRFWSLLKNGHPNIRLTKDALFPTRGGECFG